MPVITLNMYRILESVRLYPPSIIKEGFRQILQADPNLQHLVAASGGELDVMETLMLVLKEADREAKADKNYFLEKLKSHNTLSEQLSDYLGELVEASQALSGGPYKCKSKQEPLSWLPVPQLPERPQSLRVRSEK
jgi:hypothetical protein